jgi:hypothetical protein
MGSSIDIEHTLQGLEGPEYGQVRKIIKQIIDYDGRASRPPNEKSPGSMSDRG